MDTDFSLSINRTGNCWPCWRRAEHQKDLLSFHQSGLLAAMKPLVYRQVDFVSDYDAVRENGMIEARILLSRLSMTELGKLEDICAQGANQDDTACVFV